MTSAECQQLVDLLGHQSAERERRFTAIDRRFTELDRQFTELRPGAAPQTLVICPGSMP